MATVDDDTLEAWAAQASTASTWVSGSQGRKLQALADEIRATKTPDLDPPPPPSPLVDELPPPTPDPFAG